MKIAIKYLTGIVLLFAVSLYLLYPDSQRGNPETAVPHAGQRGPATNPVADLDSMVEFIVSEAVSPGLSPAVRDLPLVDPDFYLDREVFPRHNPLLLSEDMGQFDTSDRMPDSLAAVGLTGGSVPTPTLTFDGAMRSTAGGFSPPDTVGDVGPNHYVQMVNVVFTIFDKNGTVLTGPTPFNQLFSGQGGSCETQNAGDPIVVYDRQADRWLLSQFIFPAGMCIAISTTPDPTGSYHLYQFSTPQFPDYFKFGVWPDAYYMAANEGSYTAYAFDRSQMLNGSPATYQRFAGGTNLYLPSDLDGATLPPSGSPNQFYTFKSGSFAPHGGGVDRLEIWEFDVDFVTPANSSFTLAETIPVTPFNYTVCGWFNFVCIRQQGTAQRVDSVSEWPMWRLAYRNFGSHEAMVGNFAIDVTGSEDAGIRWFELRRTGGGDWTLYQEGTYAPDSHSRWMGSIAMDKAGNIALGYSVSSSSMQPAIRYTVRLADDDLGTMRPEVSLIEGANSQTNTDRWGDYSSINVDPADDCTFWYTNQYFTADSSSNWRTRVGTFIIPGCLEGVEEADLSLNKTASAANLVVGEMLTYTLTVTNNGPYTATEIVLTDPLPVELSFVTAITTDGTCNEAAGTVVCQLDELIEDETAQVQIVTTAETAGEAVNTAVVSAAEPDPNPANNSDTSTVTITGLDDEADLALTKAASGVSLMVGETLTYTLTVTNNGPDTATGIVLTDSLPAELSFVTAVTTDGTCNETAGTVVCQLDELIEDETAQVQIITTAETAGEAVNTAVVTAAETDPNPANNSDTSTVTISEPDDEADLALTKTAGAANLVVGETLTYTLTVTNNGPDTATGIVLTDSLPAELSFVTAVTTDGTCNEATGTVVCQLDELAADETAQVQIVVMAQAAGEAVNTAVVTAAEIDPNPANNSDTTTVTIAEPAPSWQLYLPLVVR